MKMLSWIPNRVVFWNYFHPYDGNDVAHGDCDDKDDDDDDEDDEDDEDDDDDGRMGWLDLCGGAADVSVSSLTAKWPPCCYSLQMMMISRSLFMESRPKTDGPKKIL